MIQLNCFVLDCKHQERLTCQKQVIEINKVGVCQSFVHDPTRFRRVAEGVPALFPNDAPQLLSVVKA